MTITAPHEADDDRPSGRRRLPKRRPGDARNELDLFASLAGIPPMIVRPADPRRSWRAGEEILPPGVADSVHQAARRITQEAATKRLADLGDHQSATQESM